MEVFTPKALQLMGKTSEVVEARAYHMQKVERISVSLRESQRVSKLYEEEIEDHLRKAEANNDKLKELKDLLLNELDPSQAVLPIEEAITSNANLGALEIGRIE